MKKLLSIIALAFALTLVGCSTPYGFDYESGLPPNGEAYAEITDNPFIQTVDRSVSTFSADVDTASYSNIRRFLNQGVLPERNAVRIEEMVNYFTYDIEAPQAGEIINVHSEYSDAPWQSGHKLLMLGLKTEDIQFNESVGMNLVFLIDVSGSMFSSEKLPLLKQALYLLVENLRPIDRISIVTYAGSTKVLLEGGDSTDKAEIIQALDRLQASGSTAGASGINLAYKVAKENFIEGGNNRIILASDGDFNVGESSVEGLKALISEERDHGIFLSVLGFGTGNYRDDIMESLADHGNGVYYYIDSLKEAEKVLVHELGGTMITVMKDVKLQVEFNPASVKAYRLIGYENRMLDYEDYEDDTKDAGDIGSGHVVIAFYEIIPVGSPTEVPTIEFDPIENLKYDSTNYLDELLTLSIRYKEPTENTSQEIQKVILNETYTTTPSIEFQFGSAVVEFGLLLRESKYKGTSSFDAIIERATNALEFDPHEYRSEFVRLVEMAKNISTAD